MEDLEKKLPPKLFQKIKTYLHSHERIIDFLKEVWVPRFDISWVILTSERVIVATRRLFEYRFVDYSLKTLDVDLMVGIPFDTIEIEAIGKKYTGHFYSIKRNRTMEFFRKIEDKLEENEEDEEDKNKKDEECPPVKTIKELSELRDKKIITEEEFEEKKKKLLEDI